MTFGTYCRRSLCGLCGLYASLLVLPPPVQAREPPPARRVHLAGGLLSVNVHDVKLVELLDELSRQADFAVASCAPCEQRISLRFDSLPLDQGLALVLRDQNFALMWKVAARATVLPKKLWLLPQVAASPQQLAAVAAVEPRTREPRTSRQPAALSLGTPQERAEAAASMARGRQPGAVVTLTRALADSDRHVRQAAIESLVEIGGSEAIGAVGLALRDGDARLREDAVNALGDLGGPQAMALLRQAQQDASAFVRRAASQTLADLHGKKP